MKKFVGTLLTILNIVVDILIIVNIYNTVYSATTNYLKNRKLK